eukprot:614034-Prorocentrum_minimum.AAC.1
MSVCSGGPVAVDPVVACFGDDASDGARRHAVEAGRRGGGCREGVAGGCQISVCSSVAVVRRVLPWGSE